MLRSAESKQKENFDQRQNAEKQILLGKFEKYPKPYPKMQYNSA